MKRESVRARMNVCEIEQLAFTSYNICCGNGTFMGIPEVPSSWFLISQSILILGKNIPPNYLAKIKTF